METAEEELLMRSLDFIDRSAKANKPFFLWHNNTRMHVWTHLSPKWENKTGFGLYADGMAELDDVVGRLLKPGTIVNDIMSHEDWLPTLMAAAGDPDVKQELLKGMKVGDKTFKTHLDGYNYPPSQRVGSMNLDQVMEQLQSGASGAGK
jgi:arylsulfatase A-like enzyme